MQNEYQKLKLEVKLFYRIFFTAFVILLDLVVFFFLALMMMNYEDHYAETDGAWYSLASMDLVDMLTFFGLLLWILMNLVALTYMIVRLIRRITPAGARL